jgi:hypothetical protein
MPETDEQKPSDEEIEQERLAQEKAEQDQRLADYNAQPRVRLQNVLNTLHGNHFDVRDHLGMLTRAVHELASILHASSPEVQPLDEPEEPPASDAPPPQRAGWSQGAQNG